MKPTDAQDSLGGAGFEEIEAGRGTLPSRQYFFREFVAGATLGRGLSYGATLGRGFSDGIPYFDNSEATLGRG